MGRRNIATRKLIEDRVIISDRGCWVWKVSKNTAGYGQIRSCGGSWLAHRLAWSLYRGPIPAGLSVLHRCDNPPCCNPEHLFLGTAADNRLDAIAKGRQAHTLPAWASRIKRARSLTDEQVRLIRHGGKKDRVFAEEMGVTRSTITRIRLGMRKQLVT